MSDPIKRPLGLMWINCYGSKSQVPHTRQLQFLQSIECYSDECCVHLSDYSHRLVKQLKRISPLRWVTGHNLKLWPGHGSGQVTIGDFTFDVVYAWGGRGKPNGGWVDRTSYTTKLTGDQINLKMRKLIDQINQHEQQSGGVPWIMSIETDYLLRNGDYLKNWKR